MVECVINAWMGQAHIWVDMIQLTFMLGKLWHATRHYLSGWPENIP